MAYHGSADDDGLMTGSMRTGMAAWKIRDPFEDSVASFVLVCVASVLDPAARPALEQVPATRGERIVCIWPERVVIPREKHRECCWKVVSDTGMTLRPALAIDDCKPLVLVAGIDGLIVGGYPSRAGTLLSVPLLQTIAAELDDLLHQMRHGSEQWRP